jgi:hypothetical protein
MEIIIVGSWFVAALLLAVAHARIIENGAWPSVMLAAVVGGIAGGYFVRFLGLPALAVHGFGLAELIGAIVFAEFAIIVAIGVRNEGAPPLPR